MLKGFVAFYGMALATMAMINASIDDDDEMTEEERSKKIMGHAEEVRQNAKQEAEEIRNDIKERK